MKCPHCGQEHPDNIKFCPETGKKLESQFWVCSNPDCDFREPLSMSAKFCPNCGKPLAGGEKKQFSKKENGANCIMLKVKNDRVKFIDTKCNTLYEESFQLPLDYNYEEGNETISNCIVSNNAKAYLVLKTGKLLEIGDYNYSENKLSISSDGEYILNVRHRHALLYKKDPHSGLALVSQFRMKADECNYFALIGEYLSFAGGYRFESINIDTGETIKIHGWKYSMLLAKRGEDYLFLASNSPLSDMGEGCHVVDKNGNAVQSFSKGPYLPFHDSNLIRIYNGKEGLISIYGQEIVPSYFEDIVFLDEKHLALHLGDRYKDWKHRQLFYDIEKMNFTTNHWNDNQKVTCSGERLPASTDELDELLKKYQLGFGYSSDVYVNGNDEIVRRIDQKVIYQMDENEYPIGASDELHRFGIYDREYLSVYDNDGVLLKEFYCPNGIANPRLYSNGIILFFDNELRELCIIDVDFKLTVIHRDSCFGGDCEAFSSNCIAVQMPFTDTPEWELYNTDGELILPEETSVFSWKKLNDELVVLETGNYKTNQNLEYDEKEGLLLNLNDNSAMPIPFPYKHAFILK